MDASWNPFQCSTDVEPPCTLTATAGEDDSALAGWECDYERNCTPLFVKIEERDWESITAFLDTGFWPYHFSKDAQSPDRQVRTWVTRLEDPYNKASGIKWSQLPLHLAIVMGAPIDILRRLVDHFPASVRCTDDEQMLPLHLALRHVAPDEVVEYLYDIFPQAVLAKAGPPRHRTALVNALRTRKQTRVKMIAAFCTIYQRTTEGDTMESRDITDMPTKLAQLIEALSAFKETELDTFHKQLIQLEADKNRTELDLENTAQELNRVQQFLESTAQELERAHKNKELCSSLKLNETFLSREELQTSPTNDLHFEAIEDERISMLEASKDELTTADLRMTETFVLLRSDFVALEDAIVRANRGTENLVAFSVEVERLKENCFQHAQEHTLTEMKALMTILEHDVNNTDEDEAESELQERLQAMQEILAEFNSQLEKPSPQELYKIKGKFDVFSKELVLKRFKSKVLQELDMLRRLLESALQSTEDMEEKDLEELSQLVPQLLSQKLEGSSLDELVTLNDKARAVKQSVQTTGFLLQTKRDLKEIHGLVQELLQTSDDHTKSDFERMASALEKLPTPGGNADGRIEPRSTISKEELRQMEVVARLKHELQSLRAEMENDGDNPHEKDANDPLKSTTELRNYDDLTAMAKELQNLKMSSQKKKELAQTKTKLNQMRSILSRQLRHSDGKCKSTVNAMKKDLDRLYSMRRKAKKHPEKMEEIKSNMESLTFHMAEAEDVINTKAQLEELKQGVDQAYDMAAEGDLKEELGVMKATLSKINLNEVEVHDDQEWAMLKKEIRRLEKELKRTELRAIKKRLQAKLDDPRESADMPLEESKAIKNAIELLDDEKIEQSDAFELLALKNGVELPLSPGKGKPTPKRHNKKKLFRFIRNKKSKKDEGKPVHDSDNENTLASSVHSAGAVEEAAAAVSATENNITFSAASREFKQFNYKTTSLDSSEQKKNMKDTIESVENAGGRPPRSKVAQQIVASMSSLSRKSQQRDKKDANIPLIISTSTGGGVSKNNSMASNPSRSSSKKQAGSSKKQKRSSKADRHIKPVTSKQSSLSAQ